MVSIDHGSEGSSFEGNGVERHGFVMTKISTLGLIRLQTAYRTPGAVDALVARLDRQLPRPGQCTVNESQRLFCSVPGEWIVGVPKGEERHYLESMQQRLDGLVALTTVITDSRVVFEMEGDHAFDILSRGSTFDFHSSNFGTGACINTRLAGLPVMLAKADDQAATTVFIDRSSEHYFRAWIVAVSAEFADV